MRQPYNGRQPYGFLIYVQIRAIRGDIRAIRGDVRAMLVSKNLLRFVHLFADGDAEGTTVFALAAADTVAGVVL